MNNNAARKRHSIFINVQTIDQSKAQGSTTNSKKGVKQKYQVRPQQEVQKDLKKPKEIPRWQKLLESFLDHPIVSIIMTITTIYALFGDDIRVLGFSKSADETFWLLNSISLGLFSLEVIIASLCKPKYFFGFFFWLDVISTLSLLLDIGWFSQLIFGSGGGAKTASSAAALARAGRASRVGTRAGRIVRVVRLIRLMKMYKIAQQALMKEAEELEKIEAEENQVQDEQQAQGLGTTQNPLNGSDPNKAKTEEQIKQEQAQMKKKKKRKNANRKLEPITGPEEQLYQSQIQLGGPSKPIPKDGEMLVSGNNMNAKDLDDSEEYEDPEEKLRQQQRKAEKEKKSKEGPVIKESNVGKKLSDLTTQRVITLVLSIMFSIPLFSMDTYRESPTSYDQGIGLVYYFKFDETFFQTSLTNYIEYHSSQRSPVINIEIDTSTNITYACCLTYPNDILSPEPVADWEDQRDEDLQIYSFSYLGGTDGSEVVGTVRSYIKSNNRLNSILSIIRTFFVSIILSAGAMTFSSDVEELVVMPIENMLEKVQRIAENPLSAANMEEQEAMAYEEILKNSKKDKNGVNREIEKKKEEAKMETSILEKLIIKTGALLALGFGEAGSQIIAENMNKGGEIDPMIPGKKVTAIIGFCDIHYFADVTKVLQQKVMKFVNEIAEITHWTVDQYCGQVNKNIGDAFLLIWKFDEEQYYKTRKGDIRLRKQKNVREFCDLPVIAFIKIICTYSISKKLSEYENNPKIKEVVPHFSIKMGFGLHLGWAIEGAIGSNFKIDASYLSPNVNMSARLEAATKQFGTQILISGPLYENLTTICQGQLRQIDNVTVKGSVHPMALYTCDLSLKNLKAKNWPLVDKFDTSHLTRNQKKKKRVIFRMKKNKLRDGIMDNKKSISQQFFTEKDIVALREIFTQEFYTTWERGFKEYIQGQWQAARTILESVQKMIPGHEDGPSKTLLNYMGPGANNSPPDWKGYRALTEK